MRFFAPIRDFHFLNAKPRIIGFFHFFSFLDDANIDGKALLMSAASSAHNAEFLFARERPAYCGRHARLEKCRRLT